MKKQKKKLEQTDDKKQKLLLGKKITELENASQELKIEASLERVQGCCYENEQPGRYLEIHEGQFIDLRTAWCRRNSQCKRPSFIPSVGLT